MKKWLLFIFSGSWVLAVGTKSNFKSKKKIIVLMLMRANREPEQKSLISHSCTIQNFQCTNEQYPYHEPSKMLPQIFPTLSKKFIVMGLLIQKNLTNTVSGSNPERHVGHWVYFSFILIWKPLRVKFCGILVVLWIVVYRIYWDPYYFINTNLEIQSDCYDDCDHQSSSRAMFCLLKPQLI